MLFVARCDIKMKAGEREKIVKSGEFFEIRDIKKEIIARLTKEQKARPVKSFCKKCGLFEIQEPSCSFEPLLSKSKICIAPYEFNEVKGRLKLLMDL